MRNNETGEFEMVVGNRQLLSGFFIVVLLFAVALAMGYILGRSSKVAETASTGSPSPVTETRPQPASPAQPVSAPAPQPVETAAQPPAGDAPPEPSTQPVKEPVVPPQANPLAAPAAEPTAGTYWQVMAVGKTDADVVVRALHDKGFPAVTSPGLKGLTRVLVGPYADRQALGRAKTELEAAGMSVPFKVELPGEAGKRE